MAFVRSLFAKIRGSRKSAMFFLFFIIFIGAFLRSYHFSDWLRFNMDQSRDAIFIKDLSDKNELPAFGPKAGGTEFRLGPAFYYFQYASAKIFGAEPEKLAYPDLLFSMLAMILFYFLAKAYFQTPIALSLTWLYAISYFAVKFSRFAWNPNSTPFFVMLFIYSIYRSAFAIGKGKYIWAALAGAALGISVQLHTSLLIIMPVFAVFALIYFIKNKKTTFVSAAILVLAALFVNTPQIISEIKTGGANTSQLLRGATNKNERNANFSRNLALNFSCHIKSNAHILTSLGNEDECDYKSDLKTAQKLDGKKMPLPQKAFFIIFAAVAAMFSLGGYYLLAKNFKKEKEERKKIFLAVLSGYAALSFLFYLAWATELSIRFFLPLSFLPFLLLGFWLEFFSGKFKKGFLITAVIVAAISLFNLQKVGHTYRNMARGGSEINGDFDYLTLGEGKYIVNFTRENFESNSVYADAQAGYLFKFFRPLRFLARGSGLEIISLEKETRLEPGTQVLYIKSADRGCEISDKFLEKYTIDNCDVYRQFSIFALRTK
ncbi:MAG: hypothetical protein QG620_412 [Patescibacteria group bacterium]|nr:hypothetical protein [Patescibacteria group bacterium]